MTNISVFVDDLSELIQPVSTSSPVSTRVQETIASQADSEEQVVPGALHLPKGQFLDMDFVITKLLEASDPLSDIPRGNKENVYFVVANDRNVEWRKLGKNGQF